MNNKKQKNSSSDFALEGIDHIKELGEVVSGDVPVTIHIIPQSHIDMAWQWRKEDTISMILSTFRDHTEILEKNPSYTYAQSQMAAYHVVETESPDLFARIKTLVKKGQWEIVGGQWVEPDYAIPSGESAVRQFLHGQLYTKRHFGRLARVGWVPDSFIHLPGNMPQIYSKSGIKYFVHKRPREKFISLPMVPYYWKGRDGTKLLSYRSNNKGWGLPILSEGTTVNRSHLSAYADAFRKKGLKSLWGPLGVGDTGGVNEMNPPPSGKGWTSIYSTPSRFFDAILKEANKNCLPVVTGPLGPMMTGALTTHAEMKTLNRIVENEILISEFLEGLAMILGIQVKPGAFANAWERLLFNQFHDIVTGCGSSEVHQEAEHDYIEALTIVRKSSLHCAREIAESVTHSGEGVPLVVFNSLGWKRTEVVEAEIGIAMDAEEDWTAVSTDGIRSPVVIYSHKNFQSWHRTHVSFTAKELLPMGYRSYRIVKSKKTKKTGLILKNNIVSTPYLKVTFDREKGGISSLVQLTTGSQIVSSGRCLGELKIHEEGKYFLDYGVELRAWYLGFTGKVEKVKFRKSVVTRRRGEEVEFKCYYGHGDSSFTQRFIVRREIPRIDVVLEADWQEIEKLLRVHFPINLNKGVKTICDSPYCTEEGVKEDTEWPMQYFCGLTDGKIGLAILNEGRYGFAVKGNEVSISVLRCSTYPDMRSDSGKYVFKYSIFPFGGDWQEGKVVREAYSVNQRPFAFYPEISVHTRPAEFSLLDWDGDACVVPVMFKKAEGKDSFILRVWNASTHRVSGRINFSECLSFCGETNLLEIPTGDRGVSKAWHTGFRPQDIRTLELRKKSKRREISRVSF